MSAPARIVVDRCANGWTVFVTGPGDIHVARTPGELVAVIAAIADGAPTPPPAEPDSVTKALRDLRQGVDSLVLLASQTSARA